MYITKSEKFALFYRHLYLALKARARAEQDGTTISILDSLFLPVVKRARSREEINLEPRSLWMWNRDISNGLELVGMGDVATKSLNKLVGR